LKQTLIILSILLINIVILSQNTKYKEVKLHPVDEAYKNPKFKEFRNKLIQAVKNKDTNFLLNHIDDKIMFSFGDDNGKKNFIKSWHLNINSQNSNIWSELYEILRLGGLTNLNQFFLKKLSFLTLFHQI